MICLVEIASEMSAWQAARVGDHARHGKLLEGRDGAGHEGTGSDFEGGGEEEDHLVARDCLLFRVDMPQPWRIVPSRNRAERVQTLLLSPSASRTLGPSYSVCRAL